ncbi:MAG: VOC family protein [Candidatus Eremiobacteraeota bacterium]|nr:VOC family protein [Candidatus Eremiobacteraeota bacterium]
MAEFQRLHHVALVARKMASAKRFYRDLLGLRLTRKTVNPDDPYTPLWVFGARPGRKGSRIEVLFYPRSTRAVPGAGMVESLALRIPPRSSEYWRRRLRKHHL